MSRATIIINSPTDVRRVCKLIENVPAGWIVNIREPKRTDAQNRLMWARLAQISREVEWYGQMLSDYDWKDIFTASLRKSRVVPGIDPGTVVVLGMHTSKMTVSEMSNLMELIGAFAAERGVELIA